MQCRIGGANGSGEEYELRPHSGDAGRDECRAEISGVDLAGPPAGAEVAEIRRALGEYGVVFFRDQQLTPEQHIAFSRCFGEIDVNRFLAAVPDYPMIAEVRKEPEQLRNIDNGWHTDQSYDEAPALGSMLHARERP